MVGNSSQMELRFNQLKCAPVSQPEPGPDSERRVLGVDKSDWLFTKFLNINYEIENIIAK